MAEVINLNRYRKNQKRRQQIKTAAENRMKSGRTKSERDEDAESRRRDASDLDNKHLD